MWKVEGTEQKNKMVNLFQLLQLCHAGLGMEQRPTKCELRLMTLERYHTKVSIENADYAKKGHRVTRYSRTDYWHCFGQQHPVGRPASAGGERPPAALKCLSWVLLCLLWLGLVGLFVCLLSGVLYSLVEPALSHTSLQGSREG